MLRRHYGLVRPFGVATSNALLIFVCKVSLRSIESQREMREPSQAALHDRPIDRGSPASEIRAAAPPPAQIDLVIHDDLASVEQTWRQFEQCADCTVFQTFDWLAAWQRHIGLQENVAPAIVVGRQPSGEILFLLPLAVVPGAVRRLTFLGCGLCDYNAPLLAP